MKTFISILIFFLVSVMAQATTYYVSSNGNDSNAGTSTGTAWQTLSRVNAATLNAGDQVLFERGGVFYGSLTISRSGASGSPITFGAYGSGSNPVISGFQSVDSWTNLGANIWESTGSVTSLSTLNMVTINGSNTPMGRYPNSGYLTFQSHSGKTSITSSSLTGTPNWTGAEVVIRATRWNLYRATITSQTSGTLNYATLPDNEPINGFGFFIQADERTLDQQNEWYFDSSTKKLQVYSSTQPTSVQVASVDNVVTVNSSYITLTDLTIQGANSYGIYNTSPYTKTNLTIQNCNVKNSGINGIYVVSTPLLVENCIIKDSNNNGIDLSNWVPNATIRGCTIENSGVFEGMAYYRGDGVAVGINGKNSSNSGNLFEYNTIRNSGYHAISFYGTSTTVQNNYIDTFCTVKDDGAGIYTYGGSRTNLKIKNNIVINGIGAGAGTTYTFKNIAEGIYLDDNTTACEVSGNTVAFCGDGGIYLHNCNNSSVTNNILFGNFKALYTGDESLGGKLAAMIITNNKFIAKTGQYTGFFYANTGDANSQDVSLIGTVDYNYYCRPAAETNHIAVLASNYTESYYSLSGWKALKELDTNSKGSPKSVTSDSDIAFAYNETAAPKIVNLGFPGVDVAGTRMASTVTLQPYTSVVVLKDLTNVSSDNQLLVDDAGRPLIDDNGLPLVP